MASGIPPRPGFNRQKLGGGRAGRGRMPQRPRPAPMGPRGPGGPEQAPPAIDPIAAFRKWRGGALGGGVRGPGQGVPLVGSQPPPELTIPEAAPAPQMPPQMPQLEQLPAPRPRTGASGGFTGRGGMGGGYDF